MNMTYIIITGLSEFPEVTPRKSVRCTQDAVHGSAEPSAGTKPEPLFAGVLANCFGNQAKIP